MGKVCETPWAFPRGFIWVSRDIQNEIRRLRAQARAKGWEPLGVTSNHLVFTHPRSEYRLYLDNGMRLRFGKDVATSVPIPSEQSPEAPTILALTPEIDPR